MHAPALGKSPVARMASGSLQPQRKERDLGRRVWPSVSRTEHVEATWPGRAVWGSGTINLGGGEVAGEFKGAWL